MKEGSLVVWNEAPSSFQFGCEPLEKDVIYTVKLIVAHQFLVGNHGAILEEKHPNDLYSLTILKEIQPPMDITEMIEDSIRTPKRKLDLQPA